MLNLALQMYTALEDSTAKISSNIGYTFKNKDLLVQAFLDNSFPLMGAMMMAESTTLNESNEDFVWRGNYILQLSIADYIEANHHSADKSTKNVLLSKYISAEACIIYANKLQVFNSYLYQCPHGGVQQQSADKLIAPFKVKCFKALLTAMYLDAGKSLEPIQQLFEDKLIVEDPLIDSRDIAAGSSGLTTTNDNYKSLLNELCQKQHLGQLRFTVAGRSGPDHAPIFKVQLTLDGEQLAVGESTSKKQAEQIAAKVAYEQLTATTG